MTVGTSCIALVLFERARTGWTRIFRIWTGSVLLLYPSFLFAAHVTCYFLFAEGYPVSAIVKLNFKFGSALPILAILYPLYTSFGFRVGYCAFISRAAGLQSIRRSCWPRMQCSGKHCRRQAPLIASGRAAGLCRVRCNQRTAGRGTAGAKTQHAAAVACYITAAYWFTASTSFANPAVTIARALTGTLRHRLDCGAGLHCRAAGGCCCRRRDAFHRAGGTLRLRLRQGHHERCRSPAQPATSLSRCPPYFPDRVVLTASNT